MSFSQTRQNQRHNPAPACRVCGCTDDRACDGGCSWVDSSLCSTCHAMVAALLGYFDQAYSFKPGRLLAEMKTQALHAAAVERRQLQRESIERRRAGALTRAARGK